MANGLVNRVGTTFVYRLSEETGATGPDIARAFTVAREVFDLRQPVGRDRSARRPCRLQCAARHAPQGADPARARDSVAPAQLSAASGHRRGEPPISGRERRRWRRRGTTCCPLPTVTPHAARPRSWLPRAFRRSSPVASGSSSRSSPPETSSRWRRRRGSASRRPPASTSRSTTASSCTRCGR